MTPNPEATAQCEFIDCWSRVDESFDKMQFDICMTWDGAPLPPESHASIRVHEDDDSLLLEVEAPFYGDPPPPGEPGHTDGLWAYEVVELFLVGEPDEEGLRSYVEIELSPHGHYLVLLLRGVRQRIGVEEQLLFQSRIDGEWWEGMARIPMQWVPSGPLSVNAFAINGQGDERRYLAMSAVPGDAPDFHRIELFPALALEEP